MTEPPQRPRATPKPRLKVTDHLRRTGAAVQDLLEELRRPGSRTPLDPLPHRRAPGELRVASYNIHKCVGIDRRFDPARTASVIAELGADLVAVQEADRRFGRRTGLMDLLALERETGLAPLPVSDLEDGHGWHGNALLVRPGTPAKIRRLTLPGAEPRGALVADLELPGGSIRVVAAHLGLLRGSRMRQAIAILQALGEATQDQPPMPTLLMGDLNEWRPGSRSSLRAFEPFFGPLAAGTPSFPTRMPVLALDRILGWPEGLVQHVAAHDSALARIASDHLPLTASVRLQAGLARINDAA